MRSFIYILIVFTLYSCEFLGIETKSDPIRKPIAQVYNESLYKEDIAYLFPKNVTEKDSLILIRGIINDWATKQLLLKRAEENNTQQDNSEVNKLVQEYRQSLLINGYKERLIKQQLDTTVSEKEISNYYDENGKNFKLNEDLLKARYIHFSSDLLDKKEVIQFFKKGDIISLEELEMRQLSFKSIFLNDSVWIPLEKVLLKTPFLRKNLLKKTKFLQKEDSLGLYLVAIQDVLKRGEVAPKSYVSSTIKQMILHKRKLQLIRDIEKIIVKDAIKNKDFKVY